MQPANRKILTIAKYNDFKAEFNRTACLIWV
jgi:hypothetical protein